MLAQSLSRQTPLTGLQGPLRLQNQGPSPAPGRCGRCGLQAASGTCAFAPPPAPSARPRRGARQHGVPCYPETDSERTARAPERPGPVLHAPGPRAKTVPPTWARLLSHAPMFPASERVAVGEFQMQPLTPPSQRRVC